MAGASRQRIAISRLATPSSPVTAGTGIARFEGVGKFDDLYGVDVGSVLLDGVWPRPRGAVFLNDAHAFALGEWLEAQLQGRGLTLVDSSELVARWPSKEEGRPTRRELEDWLKPIMMKIAAEGKTRACATLGALTPETAKFLYDCGIRRINHNIETSERHYPNIVSTHPFSERLNTLRVAKEAGLSLCSGGIFGMGEEWQDRLDMMFTLREIGVDVMPINFLNAIHGTPLAGMEKRVLLLGLPDRFIDHGDPGRLRQVLTNLLGNAV